MIAPRLCRGEGGRGEGRGIRTSSRGTGRDERVRSIVALELIPEGSRPGHYPRNERSSVVYHQLVDWNLPGTPSLDLRVKIDARIFSGDYSTKCLWRAHNAFSSKFAPLRSANTTLRLRDALHPPRPTVLGMHSVGCELRVTVSLNSRIICFRENSQSNRR